MPLKGIPPLISPELLYALASMGHGDEIVLADSNFPSESIARANGARLILSDGLPIPKLLRHILKLFPLDQYVAEPVALMDRVEDDKKKGLEVPIWNEYKQIVGNNVGFEMVERFAFYERAKKCFAVVRTYRPAPITHLWIERSHSVGERTRNRSSRSVISSIQVRVKAPFTPTWSWRKASSWRRRKQRRRTPTKVLNKDDERRCNILCLTTNLWFLCFSIFINFLFLGWK